MGMKRDEGWGTRDKGLKTQAIELHIEELVLHGFERGDREAIGEAVRLELLRLLSSNPTPQGWSQDIALDKVSAGLEVGSTQPQQIGMRVGQAVYRSLGGQLPETRRGTR
jgi:hypothetical protein